MIPTRQSAWGTAYSCSPAGQERSKLKFAWTCHGPARSPIRSWPSFRPESWLNLKKEQKNELLQILEDLCRGVLCFPARRLAVTLQLWSDTGLSVPLAISSSEEIERTVGRGPALAEHQGNLDSHGHRVRRGGDNRLAHWAVDGHEP